MKTEVTSVIQLSLQDLRTLDAAYRAGTSRRAVKQHTVKRGADLNVLVGEPALFLEPLATPQRDSRHVECREVCPLGRPHEEKLTPKHAHGHSDKRTP